MGVSKKMEEMFDLQSQTLKGLKWATIARILQAFVGLFVSIILIRTLSKQEYGTYSILLTISGILVYIVSCGIQHSTQRYIPEFIEQRQYMLAKRLIVVFTQIRFIVVAVILVTLWFYWSFVSDFLNLPAVLGNSLFFVLCIFLFQRTTEVFGSYFHSAILDYKSIAIHGVLRPILFIAAVLWYSNMQYGIRGLIFSLLIAEFFTLFFYGGSAIRYREKFIQLQQQWSSTLLSMPWKRIGSFSFYNMFYTFGGIAVGVAMDNFIVAHYFDIENVAIYAFAVSIMAKLQSINPITFFKSSFNNLFVRKYIQTSDKLILLKGVQFTAKLGLFFALPSFFLLCVLSDPVIRYLFKVDYLDAIPVLYVLGVMYILRSLTVSLTFVINTLELVRYFLILNILGVYNILMAVLLIRYYGLFGVAFATFSTEAIWCVFLLGIVRKKAKLPFKVLNRSTFTIAINTGVIILINILSKDLINGILGLIMWIFLSAILYLTLSIINKPFSQEERDMINSTLKVKIWMF